MAKMQNFLVILVFVASSNAMFPLNKRLYKALPSVSDDHFQEAASDGSYRYAYQNEGGYTAERRLANGEVEGETVRIRPDGVPIKVHYYADSQGYRPKTEILYSERLIAARPTTRNVIYRDAHDHEHTRTVVIAPPPPERVVEVPVPVPVPVPVHDPARQEVRIDGSHVSLGNSIGGETAIANPQVTAIVGPGARAELRPESFASTRSGGVAISNPSVHTVVGPGGSVVLAPSARASTAAGGPDFVPVVSSVRARHYSPGGHVYVPDTKPLIVPQLRTGYPLPPPDALPPPPPVLIERAPIPLAAPLPPPHPHGPVPVATSGVLIVPPNPSYSYEYSYSAPDTQNPSHGDNRAFVAVRVNHK